MPRRENLPVDSLYLDLNNNRTVHQKNETQAINTMIAVSPDRFWSLLESIINDGYLLTDNIIVLQSGDKIIVKEGNRRVAALKIIFNLINGVEIPDFYREKIEKLSDEWKAENKQIPCTIFQKTESQQVERMVSLIHAKGEKAGREKWTAVATARYARDQNKQPEPALDLLENYLT
jgi:hypothetical protein